MWKTLQNPLLEDKFPRKPWVFHHFWWFFMVFHVYIYIYIRIYTYKYHWGIILLLRTYWLGCTSKVQPKGNRSAQHVATCWGPLIFRKWKKLQWHSCQDWRNFVKWSLKDPTYPNIIQKPFWSPWKWEILTEKTKNSWPILQRPGP